MTYKGFEIDIDSIGNYGYSCSATRLSDGWVLVEEWHPNTKQAFECCMATIDDYYKHPDYYED